VEDVTVLVRVQSRSVPLSPTQPAALARVSGAGVVVHEAALITVGTLLLCAGLVCRVLGEALPYAGQRVLDESRLLGRPR
jgi:hypothetical protein